MRKVSIFGREYSFTDISGTLVNVKSNRKSMTSQQDFVQVDTTDILFVASGAFTALDRIVGKRLDKKMLGLGSLN